MTWTRPIALALLCATLAAGLGGCGGPPPAPAPAPDAPKPPGVPPTGP